MTKIEKIISGVLNWIFLFSILAAIWFPNIRLKSLVTAVVCLVIGIIFFSKD